MKFKFISLSILLAISTNVLAYKVISEEVKCIGKVKCGINVISENVNNVKKNFTKKIEVVSTSIDNKSGKVMQFVKIDALHMVELSNPSDEKKRYRYDMSVMCLDEGIKISRVIELEPGDYILNKYKPYVAIQKQNPGEYPISSEGILSGDGGGYTSRIAKLYILN